MQSRSNVQNLNRPITHIEIEPFIKCPTKKKKSLKDRCKILPGFQRKITINIPQSS